MQSPKNVSVRVKRENEHGTEGHPVQADSLEELFASLEAHSVQRVRLGSEIQGAEPEFETGWQSPSSITTAQFDLLTTDQKGMVYFLFTDEWREPI